MVLTPICYLHKKHENQFHKIWVSIMCESNWIKVSYGMKIFQKVFIHNGFCYYFFELLNIFVTVSDGPVGEILDN